MASPHVCRPTPDTASDCGNAVAGHEATIALMSSVRTASPLAWLILLILLCAQSAVADVITGHVVNVHDGDTLTLLIERTWVRVRLVDIDRPSSRRHSANARDSP